MLRARILLSTSNRLVGHNVAQLARHSSATVAREPLQSRSPSPASTKTSISLVAVVGHGLSPAATDH